MQREKPREIDVSAIHDVDCVRLRQQEIEHVHVMQLAGRDVDKRRDGALEIEQRVHLHRRLGGAKVCPRKDRQTHVNRRGVRSLQIATAKL